MVKVNRIIITSPSLDIKKNIGGISTVTNFVINNNKSFKYEHFELGKRDDRQRTIIYYFHILRAWSKWLLIVLFKKNILIHFNIALENRSILRDFPFLILARFMKRRMIIHLHGGIYLEKEKIPGTIKLLLNLILIGKEPKVVLSSIEQDLIKNKFRANNVFVLPNSLEIKDAKKFRRIFSGALPVKILFIGRIVKTKGMEYIFQSLKDLKQQNFPFKFILAGNGEDKEEYVKKFTEILGSLFEFKGIVTGNEKTELLKDCNVFLLPSFYEGLPISLLECMSFAMVPIVTDVGSIKNIVTNGLNGIIIRKYSFEDISDAIIKLITETKLMEQLGRSAQQSILEIYSPDKYIDKLNRIYEKA